MTRSAALTELRAEAAYTAERLALYRRRMLLGRGDPGSSPSASGPPPAPRSA